MLSVTALDSAVSVLMMASATELAKFSSELSSGLASSHSAIILPAATLPSSLARKTRAHHQMAHLPMNASTVHTTQATPP